MIRSIFVGVDILGADVLMLARSGEILAVVGAEHSKLVSSRARASRKDERSIETMRFVATAL